MKIGVAPFCTQRTYAHTHTSYTSTPWHPTHHAAYATTMQPQLTARQRRSIIHINTHPTQHAVHTARCTHNFPDRATMTHALCPPHSHRHPPPPAPSCIAPGLSVQQSICLLKPRMDAITSQWAGTTVCSRCNSRSRAYHPSVGGPTQAESPPQAWLQRASPGPCGCLGIVHQKGECCSTLQDPCNHMTCSKRVSRRMLRTAQVEFNKATEVVPATESGFQGTTAAEETACRAPR